MRWMEEELAALAVEGRERRLSDVSTVQGRPGYIWRGGRQLLHLSSNDYLGLSHHPAIAGAMRDALDGMLGTGAGASRLVTGNRTPYRELERELADWQRCEASLVIANGYAANAGVIAALVGRGDAVFSDRLNHASIVDGITLSRAENIRYRHGDMEHLRSLLEKNKEARRKLIVTDAIFSMDGDAAPLHELAQLGREYGAMLMVDEAHSEGVYGESGEGLAHACGVHRDVDVTMGTFSKAFGVYGAHVSGSAVVIRYLLQKTRPVIYSTGLPPPLVAGVRKALEIVQNAKESRARLMKLSARFRAELTNAGYMVGPGDSPIVPVIVGDNETALRFSQALEERGIAAVAIRPPTVPEGTARIRFSVSAVHREDELVEAAAAIAEVGAASGVLHENMA